MGMKTEKNLWKPINKTLKLLSNLTEKLRPKINVARFIENNNCFAIELNQIQTYSNARIHAEVENQQCEGLIYSNIVKFR